MQFPSRGDGPRLLETEGVEEVDLVVAGSPGGTRDKKGVEDPSIPGRCEHAHDDRDAQLRGEALDGRGERAVDRLGDVGQRRPEGEHRRLRVDQQLGSLCSRGTGRDKDLRQVGLDVVPSGELHECDAHQASRSDSEYSRVSVQSPPLIDAANVSP